MDVSGKKEKQNSKICCNISYKYIFFCNSIVYNVFLNKILKNTFSMEINDWVDLSQSTGEHH